MKKITIEINPMYADKMPVFCEAANDLIKGTNVQYSTKGLSIEYDSLESLFAVAKFYGQFTVLFDVKQAEQLKQLITNN